MGTARAPCSASGVPPACSARVRKPKVCSAIGLLLGYLPAGDVRGVDSGSTLYCAIGGGVHQVRVPMCRLLRIMTGYFRRKLPCGSVTKSHTGEGNRADILYSPPLVCS